MVAINDLLSSYNFKGQNLGAVPGELNFGTGFTATKTPQMLAQFAKWAGGRGGPLEASTRGAFLGQLEGMSQGELQGRNQLGYSLAAQGVSPLQARGAINERTPQFQSQVAGLRAGAESQYNTGLLNLGQATVNGIREAVDYQRMLKLQAYMFEQQQQALHKGQRMGMLGSLIGAAATLSGAGILAAAMPAAAAVAGGGGGGGGVPQTGYPGLSTGQNSGSFFGGGMSMLNWPNAQASPITDGGAGFQAQTPWWMTNSYQKFPPP